MKGFERGNWLMGTSEKKYLKWYNKLGYGSGDLAANCIYAVVTSFIMIYLTDAVGMDPAVIGILIMVSKCLDGVSDIFFGNMLIKAAGSSNFSGVIEQRFIAVVADAGEVNSQFHI